jgi:hypothetical protein
MAKQKQVQTNFRTTPEMKQRLEAASNESGLTFNKEVNRRLAESFDASHQLDPVLDDPVLFAIVIVMARAMEKAGGMAFIFKEDARRDRREWHTDAYAFARGVDAANAVLKFMRPIGDANDGPQFEGDPQQKNLGELLANLGWMYGRDEVRRITKRGAGADGAKDEALHELIGKSMTERIQANLDEDLK